jgi:U3 small nucleolar RNA-associated protein MPP10
MVWGELEMQHEPLLSALENQVLEMIKASDQKSKKVTLLDDEPVDELDKEEEDEEEEDLDLEDDDELELEEGKDEDMEAFFREVEDGVEEGDENETGGGGGTDDDEEEEVDFFAPVPAPDDDDLDDDLLEEEALITKRLTGEAKKAARLQALLGRGPRYEDFFGDRKGGEKKSAKDADKDDVGVDLDSDDDRFIDSGLGVTVDDDLEDELGDDADNDEQDDDDDDDDDGDGEGNLDEEEEDEFDNHGKIQDDEAKRRAKKRKALLSMDEPEDDNDEDEMDMNEDEEDIGNDDNDEDDDEQMQTIKPLTRHERERQALAKQIAELESEALAEKSWELTGEVGSSKRPENSLLSAVLDYTQAAKSAPPVTVETTNLLEDMIKQRVFDGTFDDPVKKEAPIVKKSAQVDVSTEKSKAGLGDIYAAEFAQRAMGQASQAEEKITKLESEVEMMMTMVFSKLDALSNLTFSPSAHLIDDMQVAPNVPAILMEEKLPLAVSDAQMRAPEEIYAKKKGREGVFRTSGEKSQQERAADRRARKAATKKDASSVKKADPGFKLSKGGIGSAKVSVADKITTSTHRGAAGTGQGDFNEDSFNSANVFGKLQDLQKSSSAGVKRIIRDEAPRRPIASLKM